MFRDLLARLTGETQAPELDGEDAELAIAALLVRLARSDDTYREVEKARIDRILACRRGLSPADAAARRAEAEELEAGASDTVRFTRQIKERIALEERAGVIAAMWEVAYADAQRGPDEESLIRLVASLLGITDRESAEIRQQVKARMGLAP